MWRQRQVPKVSSCHGKKLISPSGYLQGGSDSANPRGRNASRIPVSFPVNICSGGILLLWAPRADLGVERVPVQPETEVAVETGTHEMALPTCVPRPRPHTWRLCLGSGQLPKVWLPLALASAGTRCSQTTWRTRGSTVLESGVAARRGGFGNGCPLGRLWPQGLPCPAPPSLRVSHFWPAFHLLFLVSFTHGITWADFFMSGHLQGCQQAGGWAALDSASSSRQPGSEPLGTATPEQVWAGQPRNWQVWLEGLLRSHASVRPQRLPFLNQPSGQAFYSV